MRNPAPNGCSADEPRFSSPISVRDFGGGGPGLVPSNSPLRLESGTPVAPMRRPSPDPQAGLRFCYGAWAVMWSPMADVEEIYGLGQSPVRIIWAAFRVTSRRSGTRNLPGRRLGPSVACRMLSFSVGSACK
jgi:hypothetical protein